MKLKSPELRTRVVGPTTIDSIVSSCAAVAPPASSLAALVVVVVVVVVACDVVPIHIVALK